MNLLKLFLLITLCTFASSTCIEERATAFQSNRIGKYVPQCNEQVPAKYNAIQCHGSIGFCWCVDTDTGGKLSEVFHVWESNKRCE
jgi:hypothetical protein